jgi:AcrR family transcriptional regulator
MQRLKPEVRVEIVSAATALFAADGYDATSVAAVAERAGVSTGNVYRYFPSKEALFAAAVPQKFVAELRRKTKDQIEALGAIRDLEAITLDSRYSVLSEELVELSIENRHRVVILLARASGTPWATFEEDFRRDLVEWAFAYVRVTWPEIRVTAPLRFAVDRVYRAFLTSLAAAFVELDDPRKIREAVAHLGTHHRGGLKALFRTLAQADGSARTRARSGLSGCPRDTSREAARSQR